MKVTSHASARMAERAGLEINPGRLEAMWRKQGLPDLADGDYPVCVDGRNFTLVIREGRIITALSGDMATVKRSK